MAEAINALPAFSEVRFITKDGENIRATKQNGVVTMVGDKNGVRQVQLNDFMQYMVENAQNINLENQPQYDELSFKSKTQSSREKIKAYQKAQPKKGTAVFGFTSICATLPLLIAGSGISPKFENFLDKNKYGRIAVTALAGLGLLGTSVAVIKASKEKKDIVDSMN